MRRIQIILLIIALLLPEPRYALAVENSSQPKTALESQQSDSVSVGNPPIEEKPKGIPNSEIRFGIGLSQGFPQIKVNNKTESRPPFGDFKQGYGLQLQVFEYSKDCWNIGVEFHDISNHASWQDKTLTRSLTLVIFSFTANLFETVVNERYATIFAGPIMGSAGIDIKYNDEELDSSGSLIGILLGGSYQFDDNWGMRLSASFSQIEIEEFESDDFEVTDGTRISGFVSAISIGATYAIQL